MALTNAEKQAAWRARRDQRIKGLEAEVEKLRNRGPRELPADHEPRELTNNEQDQILHVILRLLKTVDHKHQKKFHKQFVAKSFQGIYPPSCSATGWESGRFPVDDELLVRLWAAVRKLCYSCPRPAGPSAQPAAN